MIVEDLVQASQSPHRCCRRVSNTATQAGVCRQTLREEERGREDFIRCLGAFDHTELWILPLSSQRSGLQ